MDRLEWISLAWHAQLGPAAFHRLMAILAGAEAPHDTVLPSPLITIDNVARFYSPDSVF